MDTFFAAVIDRLEAIHADYFTYLEGLSSEQLDWVPGAEMNSLCVIAVHVTAAERFWVGIAIDDMVERDRPAEFRAKGYALDELKARFAANIEFYQTAFASQSAGRLGEEVSFQFLNRKIKCSRAWALLHALDHSAEHLGHAGITRQLLDRP